jgi:D-glycero-alpha-D-manno-heptose-7-phosphate kinase
VEHFLVKLNDTFLTALTRIEANKHGIVFVEDEDCRVCGSLSDGDIRRELISEIGVDDCILGKYNRNFVSAGVNTPREQLLKLLDNKIRVIPVLSENLRLLDIATASRLPSMVEQGVYARAKAPVRISFGGGGSDLTYFFAPVATLDGEKKTGAVLNATISLYSHAVLRRRDDRKIIIHSKDLEASYEADSIESKQEGGEKFNLILSVIRAVMPEFGFELTVFSDFEIGSGLGGSSVVAAAVLGAFNEFRIDKWNAHEIAELAYQAERIYLGIAGGWQDQYATVFGGFNFIEFNSDGNVVYPLRIRKETLLELEESLVLCNTGVTHVSDDIHRSQEKTVEDPHILNNVEQNVRLTYQTKAHLLRGELMNFAESLNQAWMLKKTFSPEISSPQIDAVYEGAMSNGAVGGKLLGAGGGGYFLFFAAPFRRLELVSHLEREGHKCVPVTFENRGLVSWINRESNSEIDQ